MRIETPLLITGGGPAALALARIMSGRSVMSLMAGHSPTADTEPVALDTDSVAALGDSLGVLRPYLTASEPPTIGPDVFEHVLKHHCVADMNVTVYDGIDLVEARPVPSDSGRFGVRGVLTDGKKRWEVAADAYVDAAQLPTELNEAIAAAADLAF